MKTIIQQSTKTFKNLQTAAEALSTKDFIKWCEIFDLDPNPEKMTDYISVLIVSGKETEHDIEAILTIKICA